MSTGFHLLLAFAAILSQRAQAADILVATMTFGSEWIGVAKIAEALASRGHVVTVVAPASEKSDLMRKWPSLRYELYDTRANGVPTPLAYVPTVSSRLSDRMTFLQRVKNVLASVGLNAIGRLVFERTYDGMARRTIGGNYTMSAALARTDVWLYQSDVMFDFPRPTMPNMVSIAGHMADKVKPLSEDLEKFVQSSGDAGVVIVTFGSMVATMPAERADMLAAAFARLPQKVVWRYAGTPPLSLGSNTKTMEWLPQSDLLEAMHHGVPLIGMPLFGDQYDNIVRVVARGMAVSLDIHSVTSQEVYQAITTVITDPR
ncbi:UGT2B4 [Branchiostoma lanceolatum]|uniref:UGT2B4 protein n=1 Tax=Branchiostoma lanceolatum TaxID=7740 RepID=A0A8J9YUS3_BRALA|nr:UGT2B4 [Branchiostoma lanceolatum]